MSAAGPAIPATSFLLGLDLEDPRTMIPDGARHADRVAVNVERFLEFLAAHEIRCTCFTVGEVARRQRDLVRRIAGAGHEIACHGGEHVPVARQSRAAFREQLARGLDALDAAGASAVRGFRAPFFSLTARTPWAHEVLAELGFAYSSSVLPARSPMYGWPEFGGACRRTASGVWEIPVSLTRWPGLDVPFAGGIYFRLLPLALIRRLFRRERAADRPVVGYFHPYDVDTEQERYQLPEIRGSRLLNRLLYLNRARVFARIGRVLADGAAPAPYARYVAEHLERDERGGSG